MKKSPLSATLTSPLVKWGVTNLIYPIIVAILFLSFSLANALTFPIPEHGNTVVGQLSIVYSKKNDTLSTIGIKHDIGREMMRINNSQIPLDTLLAAKLPIVIPARFILPDYPHQGIVVNLAEMRLYYYPPMTHKVMIFPIGIGKAGNMTPLGVMFISDKKYDPYWIPPESIRKFNENKGIILPKIIRGGPDNPLGRRAMYLNLPQYLIHATNYPESVGSRGSFGCIRMTEKDIDYLFPFVAIGTPVRIIEEPYTAGVLNGAIYFEANKPLDENKYELAQQLAPVLKTLARLSRLHEEAINWELVNELTLYPSGIPTEVSLPASRKFVILPAKEPTPFHYGRS